MSVLETVLNEEYERFARMRKKMCEEYELLPKGYISKKKIKDKVYYYLQHREGKKITGVYIRENEVPEYTAKIERRRSLQKSIKEIDIQMEKIKRAIR